VGNALGGVALVMVTASVAVAVFALVRAVRGGTGKSLAYLATGLALAAGVMVILWPPTARGGWVVAWTTVMFPVAAITVIVSLLVADRSRY
jgi:hypothetical protein